MAWASDHLDSLATLVKEIWGKHFGTFFIEKWGRVKVGLQRLLDEQNWSPRIKSHIEGWSQKDAALSIVLDASRKIIEKKVFMEKERKII